MTSHDLTDGPATLGGEAGGPSLEDLAGRPRVPTARAVERAPREPGVYAWWARDAEAAGLLGLSSAGADLPIYVGMARFDLADRLLVHSAAWADGAETEFRIRFHAWVALTMGLAPWHIQQLANFDTTRPWGDSLLFEWAHRGAARFMERFLSVSWVTAPDATRARAWEARLIREVGPIFNDSGARVRLRGAGWWEKRCSHRAVLQFASAADVAGVSKLLHEQPEALAAARHGEIAIGGLMSDTPFWSADADREDERWELRVDLRDRSAIDALAGLTDLLLAPKARELYGRPGPSEAQVAASMSRFEREVVHLWHTFRTMYPRYLGEQATSPFDLPGDRRDVRP